MTKLNIDRDEIKEKLNVILCLKSVKSVKEINKLTYLNKYDGIIL